ncbi:metallophosphoesterase family protein [Thiobacter aerophilum]|uniref:Phosphoesterase n=1 Tax=Thiobacter aerophilum TaxID=3121275 RepID=A0ABV0EBT3_9BURK
MKICILSDSHDNRRLLDHAVEDAKANGAEAVLHCGDVVAPTTLRVLKKHGLAVHVIHGNNTGDTFSMAKLAHEPGSLIHYYGADAGIVLAGRNIFLVHYPHYARGMATTGDWDLVCCGHEHRPEIAWLPNIKGGRTLLVNPGTVGGVGNPPTYVLGDLLRMEFEIRDVPVKPGELASMPRVTPRM